MLRRSEWSLPPDPAAVTVGVMPDVTRLLDAAAAGDPKAAADLLPLVYDELRRLAARELAAEKPGQTLQATALLHEAYLRLVGTGPGPEWNGRGHFFAAAARAMRQVLVDAARAKAADKRGGDRLRVSLDEANPIAAPEGPPVVELLALDEALALLEAEDPPKARLVELRYFAGRSGEEAVEISHPADRSAYLDRACGDAALRARLERLVADHFRAGGFLERALAAAGPDATASLGPGEAEGAVGTRVGPYALRELVGEGG